MWGMVSSETMIALGCQELQVCWLDHGCEIDRGGSAPGSSFGAVLGMAAGSSCWLGSCGWVLNSPAPVWVPFLLCGQSYLPRGLWY